jgi:hypothetical protein
VVAEQEPLLLEKSRFSTEPTPCMSEMMTLSGACPHFLLSSGKSRVRNP